MALTISVRLATVEDAPMVAAAARIAGSAWETQSAINNILDDQAHIYLAIANWPERSLVNRPVAMCHWRQSSRTVDHLAIDPALVPDTQANRAARLRLVDRVLAAVVQRAINRGATTGSAEWIKTGTPISAYIESITGVTKTMMDAARARYSMDLAAALAFLQARTPA